MHAKGVALCERTCFLPSKHLLSAFYETLLSKNPSKNVVSTENPYRRLLRIPSKKRLLLENLLRTLLRNVRLHDALGVHPTKTVFAGLPARSLQKVPKSEKNKGGLSSHYPVPQPQLEVAEDVARYHHNSFAAWMKTEPDWKRALLDQRLRWHTSFMQNPQAAIAAIEDHNPDKSEQPPILDPLHLSRFFFYPQKVILISFCFLPRKKPGKTRVKWPFARLFLI